MPEIKINHGVGLSIAVSVVLFLVIARSVDFQIKLTVFL